MPNVLAAMFYCWRWNRPSCWKACRLCTRCVSFVVHNSNIWLSQISFGREPVLYLSFFSFTFSSLLFSLIQFSVYLPRYCVGASCLQCAFQTVRARVAHVQCVHLSRGCEWTAHWCGVRIAIVRAREKKSAIFHELRYPLPIPHMDVVARLAAVARHLLQSCSFAHYVTSSSSVHLSMYYNTSGERGDILLFLSFNCFHFFNQIVPVRNVPCVLRQRQFDTCMPHALRLF